MLPQPSAHAAFSLQPAQAQDFEDLLALHLRAMRQSLERLGRYDERRARERLAAQFDPAHTQHLVVDGRRVGFFVLKTLSHALRLDNLCIEPDMQRRGLGHQLLSGLCAEADRQQLPLELVALKGSDANRFYLRHGFVATGDGDWDIDYVRLPQWPSVRAVRSLWSALQARDWAHARAQLFDQLQVTWWTSGERIDGADAFIAVQQGFPDGWAIRVLELERLEDGRVLSLLRVDQPPQTFYATSIARVDDGLIHAIDEYWATHEEPPAWRTPAAIAGLSRFDPLADPRATDP